MAEGSFVVGREYTRDDVHAALGGSKVSCLPTKDGLIVAACLSRSFSPAAPQVVLCGQGLRTGPLSEQLTRQRGAIPIFVKRGANRWGYEGRFRVAESLASGARFARFIEGSGRTEKSVSFVVVFEPV